MADNELDSMLVSFGADFSQLTSAVSSITSMFDEIGAAAGESSSVISEGITSASESFSTFSEAGSSSIDQIIELLDQIAFNTTGVTDAIDTMSSDISSAVGESTSAIEELSSQFDNLSVSASASAEATSEASSSAESSGNGGFMSLFNQIGFGLMNLGMFKNMVEQVGQSLLGPAISAETVTSALTTLTGSTTAANKEMANLDAFASHTPFQTLDIDQAAEELQGFGQSANNVIPELTAIGDALGSVGRDTPAELDSVVQIFGKITDEGKISAQTMNELGAHGIDGWKALAAGAGVSEAQVKEMVSKGLIPAQSAINDLTKGIEDNPLYAGGMSRAAGTFSGLMSTLQSNFDQVLTSFGSPIIKALEGQLSNLGTLFASQSFKDFAGDVGQGIVNVFSDIGGAVSKVGSVLSGLHIGDAFGEVSSSLSSLSKNTAVTGFISSLQTGFQAVSGIVGGQLSDDFKTFTSTAESLGKWWQSTMSPAIAQAMPGFESLGKTIATQVAPAFAKIWAVGQQVARDLLPPLTKAFETIAPIVVKVGGAVANELGKGLQFIMPYLVEAADAIGQFAGEIITKATPVVEELWNSIQSGINVILPIWNAVWPSMQEVLGGVWKMISGTVQIAWSLVSGIIKTGLDLLSGNWSGAWNDIKDTFSGVWNGLNTIVDGAWSTIKGTVAGGINAVIGLINDFINGLDKMHINVPGIGNVGFSIPDIPLVHFATGGFLGAGQIGVAGEEGPELIFGGSSGVSVMNHAQSMAAMAGGEVHLHNHNHVYINGREIAEQTMIQVLNQTRSGHPIGSIA